MENHLKIRSFDNNQMKCCMASFTQNSTCKIHANIRSSQNGFRVHSIGTALLIGHVILPIHYSNLMLTGIHPLQYT